MRYFYFLCLFVFYTCLGASDIQFSASVDRTEISIQDYLTYKVTLSGEKQLGRMPQFKLPDFSGLFEIVSTSKSNSYSLVNGQMSSSTSHQYRLRPLKTGRLIVPPSELRYEGQTYRTDAMAIQVEKGPSSVSGGSVTGAPVSEKVSAKRYGNIFVLARTLKSQYYVGEQIVYRLNLYRSVRLFSDIQFELPSFTGFLVENLDLNPNEYLGSINQKQYYVKELLHKALFAVKPGVIRISSPKVGVVLNIFDGQSILKGDPIDLEILPLPEKDKPAYFSGLVGQFGLDSTLDQRVVTQNKPLSLWITLSGSGNLQGVTDLSFNTLPEFKIYKSGVKDELNTKTGFSGKRVFEYIVIPKKAGDFVVPSFRLSFFSPEEHVYKMVQTEPISIKVQPSSLDFDASPVSYQNNIQVIDQDIRYLNLDGQAEPDALFWRYSVWLVVLLGLFLWLFSMIIYTAWPYFRRRFDIGGHQGAYKRVLYQLEDLKKGSFTITELVEKSQHLFLSWLSVKMGTSLTGVSYDTLNMVLTEQAIDDSLKNSTLQLLNDMSFIAYAPDSGKGSSQEMVIEKFKKQIEAFKHV